MEKIADLKSEYLGFCIFVSQLSNFMGVRNSKGLLLENSSVDRECLKFVSCFREIHCKLDLKII